MKTKCIIRKPVHRSYGEVIAFFPEIKAGSDLCMSYQHVGQHGGASLDYMRSSCRAVSYNDAPVLSLIDELKSLGYDLELRKTTVGMRLLSI